MACFLGESRNKFVNHFGTADVCRGEAPLAEVTGKVQVDQTVYGICAGGECTCCCCFTKLDMRWQNFDITN